MCEITIQGNVEEVIDTVDGDLRFLKSKFYINGVNLEELYPEIKDFDSWNRSKIYGILRDTINGKIVIQVVDYNVIDTSRVGMVNNYRPKRVSVKLGDLTGEQLLSGVSFGCWDDNHPLYNYENPEDSYGLSAGANTLNFVLNGITYTAVEDPSDGYRSSMEEIFISAESACNNRFEPVRVFGTMREGDWRGEDSILDLYDMVTTKRVLSIGTSNIGDYYPSWVAEFTPENMVLNRGG